MATFKYKGFDISGVKTDGEIVAETLDEAERRIAARAVTIISIIPAGMRQETARLAADARSKPLFGGRVSEADVAAILDNLGVMAETGVPFIEAIEAVIAGARTPRIAEAMEEVKAGIVGGRTLSAAMRDLPWMFPPVVCGMIRVAEEGSHLDQALRSAAEYLNRAADLRRRIAQAMQYPIVMISVASLTVLVLMVFVLPKFADIFLKMQAQIPWTTRMLLTSGTSIRQHPFAAVLTIVGAVAGLRYLLRNPTFKDLLMSTTMRMPVLGPLLVDIALSRALQSLSTMLACNVPLMDALEHSSKVAGNSLIANALMDARRTVEHGSSLSEAFATSRVMPKVLIQMLLVGEKTGRLSDLMSIAARRMDEAASVRLKMAVGLIEPIMMVMMGLVVGTITVSVISPIYSVMQNIK